MWLGDQDVNCANGQQQLSKNALKVSLYNSMQGREGRFSMLQWQIPGPVVTVPYYGLQMQRWLDCTLEEIHAGYVKSVPRLTGAPSNAREAGAAGCAGAEALTLRVPPGAPAGVRFVFPGQVGPCSLCHGGCCAHRASALLWRLCPVEQPHSLAALQVTWSVQAMHADGLRLRCRSPAQPSLTPLMASTVTGHDRAGPASWRPGL